MLLQEAEVLGLSDLFLMEKLPGGFCFLVSGGDPERCSNAVENLDVVGQIVADRSADRNWLRQDCEAVYRASLVHVEDVDRHSGALRRLMPYRDPAVLPRLDARQRNRAARAEIHDPPSHD